MTNKKKSRILKISFPALMAACVFLAALAAPAHAQRESVDRAIREVDRPYLKEAEEKLSAPPQKPVIEEKIEREKAKGPSFLAKDIKLAGVESFPPEDFDPLIGPYEGREVSMDDLDTLAQEIAREYLRKGVISACFVPPQEVREGVVTIQVVEARMGKLNITPHKYFEEDMLRFYWDIRPGEILNYEDMSRSLYLMNKNPDRTVKATLYAGEKPRTTDITLDTVTRFPFHFTWGFDREGTPASGKERWTVGVLDNNFLFVDDTLIFGYTFGQHFYGIYGYHAVPITDFGTSVMYGYSASQSIPQKQYALFGLESESQTASVSVHQDLFQKGAYRGEAYIGFDAKDKTTWVTQGTLNRDRLRILNFGCSMIHEYPGAVTFMNPELSQGINGLGARDTSPMTSREASNTFSIFNLSLSHTRALPNDFRAVFKFKCQLASEALPSIEQYSLGGMNSVRGYPDADFLADDAFQTNFELLIPPFMLPEEIRLPVIGRLSIKDLLTGVVFFDYGYGQKRGNRANEENFGSLAGMGTGLRIKAFNRGTIRLEWGFPYGDRPQTETSNARFHIAIDLKY